ncbi:MAG: GNAT family N-acetyltransferase [Micromonosporaceae bacterium]
MDIVKVDPYDEPALRAWHTAFSDGRAAERESPANWAYEELLALFRQPPLVRRTEPYAAVEGDRTVGAAVVQVPVLDNLNLFEFEVAVPLAERRRGVGSALFEHVVGLARAEGRGSLLVEVVEPYQGRGPTGNVPFAEHRGFTCRNREVHRILDLPVTPATLERLAAEAAGHQGGYRLRSWIGPCPGDIVDQYVALQERFIGEVPLGEIDYEPEHWDADRLRAEEDKLAAQRRTAYTSVAVAPDGELVGHTFLMVPAHDPGQVYQADTLVLPEHRGHRLGLALKVANLRLMTAAHPDRRRVHTWNAAQNTPMNAVNDALGFRPVEQMGEYQRDL